MSAMPEECAEQWEIILLLLSSEEIKIDRTNENEVDTMNYFYNNEGVRMIFLQWLKEMKMTYATSISSEYDNVLKDNEVSLMWRQKGNDSFRLNSIEDSYGYYTKSVLYAEHQSIMYALALANRSAALLKLKRYRECLSDLELAIANGYPLDQHHKLMMRKADCFIELGQRKEAREALDTAIEQIKSLKVILHNVSDFERNINFLEKKYNSVPEEVAIKEQFTLPDLYLGENPNFKAASDVIELRQNDTVGRHVVTKANTKRGDVLFSEEPFAWVTLNIEETLCEMCCEAQINPVPCSVCSRTVFCHERCRLAAKFHRWECAAAQFQLFPTIGIAHLALRVLLISTCHGFPVPPLPLGETCTAIELFKSYAQVDKIKIYHKDTPPFFRMYNLVTNFDKMANKDYVQYALTATMLTLYLENYTTFFDDLPSRLPCSMSHAQMRLFAGAIILRSLGQLVCNGHATLSLIAVNDYDETTGRTITEKEVRRATAIYPSAAMMNHSCDPNIINTFYKNRLIIRCSRELGSGAEVLNCYGPHRSREPTHLRRSKLRAQYMFTCNCTDCLENDKKNFSLIFTAYACTSCKGPISWNDNKGRCLQCNAVFKPSRAFSLIDHAKELASQADHAKSLEERCEKMLASYRLKQQVWHRQHVDLRMSADKLARLYAEAGEFGKSMELIKQNIQNLEYQFGSFSVEVAHELRKLTSVMLERIATSPEHDDHREWCLEAHKIIKKAIQVMELNYGSWEPLVAKLKEQKEILAAILADSRTPEAADCIHHNLHYNLKI